MGKVETEGKAKQYKGLDARVGVLLSAETRDWLQAHSKATDIPLTVHVRRAIDLYRASIERKNKRTKPEPVPF
jgi:hypothetical protein